MKAPVLFVGHGSPMNVILDNPYTRRWTVLGEQLEKPKGVIAVSAHWYKRETCIGTQDPYKQIYDMSGFPQAVYEVEYQARYDKALGDKIQERLGDACKVDNAWGFDHGLWSVTKFIWPEQDVPFAVLSVDASLSPAEIFALGQKLGALRDEGYMLLCSGNVVHNLRQVDWNSDGLTAASLAFDDMVESYITKGDFAPLIDYKNLPGQRDAFPTPDHYLPLLYALGAVRDDDKVTVFNKGGELGCISMTSYLWE